LTAPCCRATIFAPPFLPICRNGGAFFFFFPLCSYQRRVRTKTTPHTFVHSFSLLRGRCAPVVGRGPSLLPPPFSLHWSSPALAIRSFVAVEFLPSFPTVLFELDKKGPGFPPPPFSPSRNNEYSRSLPRSQVRGHSSFFFFFGIAWVHIVFPSLCWIQGYPRNSVAVTRPSLARARLLLLSPFIFLLPGAGQDPSLSPFFFPISRMVGRRYFPRLFAVCTTNPPLFFPPPS